MASIYGAWSDYMRGQYPGGSKVPAGRAVGGPASVPNPNARLASADAVPLPTTRRAGTTAQGTFSSKQPW
jgi:hypothetical protein